METETNAEKLKKKIAKNIVKHRTGKLTQEELASRLNISQGQISRIESGQVDVAITMICKIAKILRIKRSTLIS